MFPPPPKSSTRAKPTTQPSGRASGGRSPPEVGGGSRSTSQKRGTWTRGRRGNLRTAQSGTRGPLRATRWRPPAPGSGRPSAPGARGLQAARPGSSPAASPAPGAPGSQRALGPGGAQPWRDADVPCPPPHTSRLSAARGARSPRTHRPHDGALRRRCRKPTSLRPPAPPSAQAHGGERRGPRRPKRKGRRRERKAGRSHVGGTGFGGDVMARWRLLRRQRAAFQTPPNSLFGPRAPS